MSNEMMLFHIFCSCFVEFTASGGPVNSLQNEVNNSWANYRMKLYIPPQLPELGESSVQVELALRGEGICPREGSVKSTFPPPRKPFPSCDSQATQQILEESSSWVRGKARHNLSPGQGGSGTYDVYLLLRHKRNNNSHI